MVCPKCHAEIVAQDGARVLDSRRDLDGSIKRKRRCPNRHEFLTHERTEENEIQVMGIALKRKDIKTSTIVTIRRLMLEAEISEKDLKEWMV